MTRVAVLDYGMGNLRSVEKALERVGAKAEITSDPDRAENADGLVLPGVGAFPRAMERVRDLDFDRLILEAVAGRKPVLGVCLGMQLLFEHSDELGGAEGLGVLGGEVRRLDAPGVKLPHIGWEPIRWRRESPLVAGVPDATPFYFVHSFAPAPAADSDVLGTAAHGSEFVCAVERDCVWGIQCHPEKSSSAGLRLYENFVRVASAVEDVGGVVSS